MITESVVTHLNSACHAQHQLKHPLQHFSDFRIVNNESTFASKELHRFFPDLFNVISRTKNAH